MGKWPRGSKMPLIEFLRRLIHAKDQPRWRQKLDKMGAPSKMVGADTADNHEKIAWTIAMLLDVDAMQLNTAELCLPQGTDAESLVFKKER